MIQLFPAWKDDQSYPYLAIVSYNGYNYRYLNKDAPSTVGVKPNVETFTLNINGDSRNVRSWMVADYLEYVNQFELNTDLQEVRGIYGDPSVQSVPPIAKRSIFRFNAAPNNMIPIKTGGIGEAGSVIGDSVQKILRSNKYYEFDVGFSVEYGVGQFPAASYVLTEGSGDGSAPDGIGGSLWIGIEPGFQIDPDILKPKITMWAMPGRHMESFYSQENKNFISTYLGLMTTFGIKYKYKYKVRYFDPLPGTLGSEITVEYEQEVSSGPFRDNFRTGYGGYEVFKEYNPAAFGYKKGELSMTSIEQITDTMGS